VIRVDLLGFGGSEKPSGGYSMEDQGRLAALALGRLRVEGAVVIGHSMGFDVATALAAQSSELVDRLVDIDMAPDSSYGDLPLTARLGFVPVLGQALRRILPDFAVRKSYGSAFAPGYDVSSGFRNPNQVIDDYNAMTYTSYDSSAAEQDAYVDQQRLDDRVRTAAVPLLVIFGTEDQLVDDPRAAAQAYRTVPGAQIKMIPDAGHSPQVEKPAKTARAVLRFATGARG
jgi:pimeloyl-ACP methyl ester carboxylesterase